MRTSNEICEEIVFLAEKHLDLVHWGFKESIRLGELNSSTLPTVIFNSQRCRLKISFREWHPPHQLSEYSLYISYGRTHAPDDKNTFVWDNEECHCWHEVSKSLHFIDNASPEFVSKNILSHELIKKFGNILSAKDLPYKLPEWEIRKHAYIWEHYAPNLFDLFDIRQNDLWEKYRRFLKDVYDIKGRNPIIKPPLDKVC